MSTEGKSPEEVGKEAAKVADKPTVPTKANTPDGKLEVKSRAQATEKTKTPAPEDEGEDRFADARDLAQRNHDAEQARNEEARADAEAADDEVTELKAKPEQTKSKNPEQVKVSSKFPEAK